MVNFITRYGIPEIILSNQGANLISEIIQILCKNLGIIKFQTSPYRPQSNGTVERFHRCLKDMLHVSCMNTSIAKWDWYLSMCVFAYRCSVQMSTGYSPFQLVYGYEVQNTMRMLKDIWTDKNLGEEAKAIGKENLIENVRRNMHIIHKWALQNLKSAKEKSKLRYDMQVKLVEFEEGDFVLML